AAPEEDGGRAVGAQPARHAGRGLRAAGRRPRDADQGPARGRAAAAPRGLAAGPDRREVGPDPGGHRRADQAGRPGAEGANHRGRIGEPGGCGGGLASEAIARGSSMFARDPDDDDDDASRRAELEQVLADYMERVDRGEPVDRGRFLAEHPDFAGDLSAYFEASDDLLRLTFPARAADRGP